MEMCQLLWRVRPPVARVHTGCCSSGFRQRSRQRLLAPRRGLSSAAAGHTRQQQPGGEEQEPVSPLNAAMKRQIATLMGAQFLMSCGYGCIAPVLPGLAVDLGVGAAGAGLLLSAPALMRLGLNIPAGRMADDPRIGRSPLLFGGCVLMTAGAGASAVLLMTSTGSAGSVDLLPSMELLLATRLVFGAGSAFASAGTQAYIADVSQHIPAQRARLMGVQTTMVNLGSVTNG